MYVFRQEQLDLLVELAKRYDAPQDPAKLILYALPKIEARLDEITDQLGRLQQNIDGPIQGRKSNPKGANKKPNGTASNGPSQKDAG